MDAAAIDWAYFYHPQAIKAGREYASHIFMTNYGKYYYRDAIIGEEESVDVPIEPLSVGWVHSHQNSSWVKANIFASDADIDISESRNIIGYVVTPAGDIQRYKPLGDYGRAVDPRGNVGTLTWIHYDWWGLGGSNGWKFFWNKNALDRRLDELRGTLGSIQGPQYGATWNLVHG